MLSDKLAKEEGLDVTVLNHYLSEYDYLQKEQPEIIEEALKDKHLGLIKKRKALTRILDKLSVHNYKNIQLGIR